MDHQRRCLVLFAPHLQRAVGLEHANIARVQPAIFIERLPSFLRLVAVATKDVGAADIHLAPRRIVSVKVLEIRHIHQLYLGKGGVRTRPGSNALP